MSFAPVETLEDLDGLDHEEIYQGYLNYRGGDPQPGENLGRAYWHGWCNARVDHGHAEKTEAMATLARAVVKRDRERYANGKVPGFSR